MNVRRRSGLMGEISASSPKNTNTTRKASVTQAKDIKNIVCPPRAIGPTKIKGAVSGPSGG